MVTLKTNKQATKAPPIDNRRRNRLLRGHGAVCGTVTPYDDGLATWRALRVLIVDHQQDIAGGLFSLAGRWEHTFRMAYHSQADLILAADELPDVVLLNLELPSMVGRRLARQLRLDSPQSDCLIIAFAEWADDECRRQCGEAGIDLLLDKPVDPSVLDVVLGLESVRINRQRAAKAGIKHLPFQGNRSATC